MSLSSNSDGCRVCGGLYLGNNVGLHRKFCQAIRGGVVIGGALRPRL